MLLPFRRHLSGHQLSCGKKVKAERRRWVVLGCLITRALKPIRKVQEEERRRRRKEKKRDPKPLGQSVKYMYASVCCESLTCESRGFRSPAMWGNLGCVCGHNDKCHSRLFCVPRAYLCQFFTSRFPRRLSELEGRPAVRMNNTPSVYNPPPPSCHPLPCD